MAQPIASLIVRVAADLAELKTGVADINTTLGGVEGFAKTAGAALGAAFSVRQITDAGAEVIAITSRLDDLARRYKISAVAVQELDFAAKQNGTTFETVGNAMAKMSLELVGGDKSTVSALDQLGLSLSELRAMAPDQAFQAIATAIAAVPKPMEQSALNTQLFGKGANQLLPLITSNLGALRDQAHEAGVVISDELVKSGDDLGDTWAELQTKIDNLKAQALLPLMKVFLDLPKGIQTTIALSTELMPSLTGIGTVILAAGGPTAALAMLGTAFTAILPFLLPAGAIILGIVAIYLAFQKWDRIQVIVAGVYTAVKTWLVDAFDGIVSSVKAKLDAVLAFFTAMYDRIRAIFASIASLGGAAAGMLPEGLGGFGGARVGGGPVAAGQAYLVGERGPELFRPQASGTIVPNGGGWGGSVTNIYITQPLGTSSAIAAAVDQALMDRQRNMGTRF